MSEIASKYLLDDVPIKHTVDEWLEEVSYDKDPHYVPSVFALEMINFIKLVNGVEGEEHKSPVLHMKMLDQIAGSRENIINMLYRGSGKTTLMGEYLFLYIAVYGGIPGFGEISIAIYVSDSIENGVKNMRKNLEYRWENSDFLQKYLPHTRFTDVRYEFTNIAGKKLIIKGYGAKTGVRGTKEMGRRVDFALLDDLVSDDDARSPTVIAAIEDTVYNAIDYAMNPARFKIIWNGTPFNQNDPLYKAVESGAWHVNVYPVCEHFNDATTEKTFKGAWEDRHTFKYVRKQYEKAKRAGRLASFNQELMLMITSDEERLVRSHDIQWFDGSMVEHQEDRYNFYITTDFATSEKQHSDYSVISVWAYNNNGDWMLVDGQAKQQLMDKNIDDLFDYAIRYNPRSVGVEISGQQGGFISWIRKEMVSRNVFFQFAGKGTVKGIRPTADKMSRFHTILPMFKQGKMWFSEHLKGTFFMEEMVNELERITGDGMKSRHDDCIDTVSMLSELSPWKPAKVTLEVKEVDDPYAPMIDQEDHSYFETASYIV